MPWHAAHSQDGTGRWATDEASFSYIASGRLLVDVARRPVSAPTRSGLVIGNPDTGDECDELAVAGVEATTIFSVHYPDGRYCGRSSDPRVVASSPGTPADVLGWLTGASPARVLHLACHESVRADGSATAIGSLWPVPDHQTAQLMVTFHDNLASRHRPAHVALREAQRAMRSIPGSDRADWAGFVHLGH